MVDSSGSSMMEVDDEYLDNEAESSHHHGSDSESSDHHGSDSHVDGHVHPDDASDENVSGLDFMWCTSNCNEVNKLNLCTFLFVLCRLS